MSVLARSEDTLGIFNHLLHDLYFEIPDRGFAEEGGKVTLNLCDRDHVSDRAYTNRYRLVIHNVKSCENIGDLAALPGFEAELNVIKFDPRKGEVRLVGVHPYELRCQVAELLVELDQLPDEA